MKLKSNFVDHSLVIALNFNVTTSNNTNNVVNLLHVIRNKKKEFVV